MSNVIESTPARLADLSESEWNQLSHRWSRGCDWVVEKIGRKWIIGGTLGEGAPNFKTKGEAYDAATALVLAEARRRAAARDLAQDSLPRVSA